MKKNNNNTILLIVIAIATLIVSLVGATFAYFTNSIKGEDASIVQVSSAILEIAFDGVDGGVLSATGIEPMGTEATSENAVLTKSFKLTPKNTTDKAMYYSLYLIVDETTFTNHNPATISGVTGTPKSLSVRLINDGASGIPTVTKYVPGKSDTDTVTITDNETGAETSVKGVELGSSSFAAGATGDSAVHEYTVEIYFLNNTSAVQDNDKGANFTGHLTISTAASSQAIS